MSHVRTYRDLLVWQKGRALVTSVYLAAKAFPRDEIYGLTSQLRRCAVSIPSNIAEGHSRTTRKEFLRFLEISLGSLFELQTQLEIAKNLSYLAPEAYTGLKNQSREVERMLTSFMRSLKRGPDSTP
jgi:four helix bundle protein